ncbi:MAG TPA: S-adenosylmethionine decarboxylase [Candidatus Nanoarchaeia archaeon]|nr:S-adenosylmethionine decarboxylase [Candidatus Nanoarchaeia archaeon]
MLNKKTDREILTKFEKEKPWGMSCSVDLSKCNAQKIRDADAIKQFVIKLCDLIKMKRFGEPVVVNFGEDPRVSGFSMTQLIETSLISGHFANQTNAAYLDIFSCKEYPPKKMAEFCKEYFEAEEYKLHITFR